MSENIPSSDLIIKGEINQPYFTPWLRLPAISTTTEEGRGTGSVKCSHWALRRYCKHGDKKHIMYMNLCHLSLDLRCVNSFVPKVLSLGWTLGWVFRERQRSQQWHVHPLICRLPHCSHIPHVSFADVLSILKPSLYCPQLCFPQ